MWWYPCERKGCFQACLALCIIRRLDMFLFVGESFLGHAGRKWTVSWSFIGGSHDKLNLTWHNRTQTTSVASFGKRIDAFCWQVIQHTISGLYGSHGKLPKVAIFPSISDSYLKWKSPGTQRYSGCLLGRLFTTRTLTFWKSWKDTTVSQFRGRHLNHLENLCGKVFSTKHSNHTFFLEPSR